MKVQYASKAYIIYKKLQTSSKHCKVLNLFMEVPNKILISQGPLHVPLCDLCVCEIASDTAAKVFADHQSQRAAAEQHKKLAGRPGHTYAHLSSTSCSAVNTQSMPYVCYKTYFALEFKLLWSFILPLDTGAGSFYMSLNT